MTKNDQLYEQIKDLLKANLDPIRSDVEEIKHTVNGNGKKGLLQRVEALEGWRYYIIGITVVVVSLLSFFGEEIKSVIFK